MVVFFSWYGFSYEIGLSVEEDNVLWGNGPFSCGKRLDSEMFSESLSRQLLTDEQVVSDSGYSESECCTSDSAPENVKHINTITRSGHETVDEHLKNLNPLRNTFSHNLYLHQYVSLRV